MIAADKNNAEAVTALLDGNADVSLENSYGNTAYVLTENAGIKTALEAAGSNQLIKYNEDTSSSSNNWELREEKIR